MVLLLNLLQMHIDQQRWCTKPLTVGITYCQVECEIFGLPFWVKCHMLCLMVRAWVITYLIPHVLCTDHYKYSMYFTSSTLVCTSPLGSVWVQQTSVATAWCKNQKSPGQAILGLDQTAPVTVTLVDSGSHWGPTCCSVKWLSVTI